MLRKVLVSAVSIMIGLSCFSGCRKSSSDAESGQEKVKTMAEYRSEAKKEINRENMAKELDRIERELEQELSEEP